ncbi:baseplate J/gp47 family protein [Vallitalea guaymasensis]|uniref:baseplate J/gp47 family protein n=1 Tax=Vallitalea guaymasensis TaxID=1185412 RepID=UPI000DE3F1E6|nr:baseplate J/gp47 family protein [Vallitalea guaymasensis]
MDKELLDEIIPFTTAEEMESKIEEDLKESDFPITNFKNGGIFKTIITIFTWVVGELIDLLQSILPQMFLTEATGAWLDIKAFEYGKKRKQAVYTEGLITCGRIEKGTELTIHKGIQFRDKTKKYLFITKEDVTMDTEALTIEVPVKAEVAGKTYNLPSNTIVESVQYLVGIDSISNGDNWITIEGTDKEDDDSLRNRCFGVWDELASKPTGKKYEYVAMGVEGVVKVYVNDLHPRGQGTIDIIITSATGEPTQALKDKVLAAVGEIKGSYDNILIKGATTITQDVNVTIYVDKLYVLEDEIINNAKEVINKLFEKNHFYIAETTQALMNMSDSIKNLSVSEPTADVTVEVTENLKAGTITVTVIKV